MGQARAIRIGVSLDLPICSICRFAGFADFLGDDI
jgi:hypothetical protein